MLLLLLVLVLTISLVYSTDASSSEVTVNSVNLIADLVSFYRTYLQAGILLLSPLPSLLLP